MAQTGGLGAAARHRALLDAPLRALKQELITLEARQLVLKRELAEAAAPAPLLRPNLAEV
jgi:hypothetical protein